MYVGGKPINKDAEVLYLYKFGVPVGFSDHTVGLDAAPAAVARGAAIIEKHVTLHADDDGLDAEFSVTAEEFDTLVKRCRDTYLACQDANSDVEIYRDMKVTA